ncbi:MAG: hypothetical protein IJ371_03840, partial [Clostridia bacterium]|nr:hypothetical protein [Clostridia bacterium]
LLDSALSTIKDAKLAHTGNITLNENPKVITNLTGGALFNCIDKGALIANVVLENSRANYAPVVNIVGTDKVDEDISEATLYKVSLKTKVIANNDRLAGFVNHVEEDNTLNIHSIATGENILLNANGLAGTVAGVVNTNNGTINVKNSFSETTIQVERVEGKTVAGFINSNNGTINLYSPVGLNLTTSDNLSAISGFATNNAGTICQASEETIVTNEGVLIQNSAVNFGKIGITTDYIAGLVGNMTDGSITGFDISFTGMPDSTYSTKMFGGAVASMSGGTLGDDNQSINISYMNATGSDQNWIIAEVFGGVVAEVDGDSASLKNIILNVEKGINISGSDADDSAAYGMIIGKYLFALNEIYYSITKDIVLHVANGANVGGVIGYATASSFNFTNSQDSDLNGKLVKVYGKKNVGGFIGHCKGTSALQLKEESSLWAIGQDNIFAQVGVAIPKTSSTGVTSFIAENFGGLIGYWDSTSTLSCSVNGQSQQLVNINEIISDNNFILGASGNIDGVVTNIGGIVGKCSADITNARNEGNIGTDLSREEQVHKGLNPLYTTQVGTTEINGTISSLMKFMYVGGIVGCVDTTNKSITISACSNVGNIQGVYAVGGIVGGAPNKSSVTVNEIDESNPDAITLSAISSKAPTIMGLADVGGIIGRADTFTYKGYQGVIANNVIGVANVGGVVGNSTNTTINNCVVGDNSVKTMITGNYNVGGFAGYVEALRMNVSLTEGSTSSSGYTASIQNVMVNGSVYDRVLGEKVYYYLPTNIGGAVGYISGSANIYNINTSAEVRTDDTFIIETRDDGNNSEVTVSLALTYVATNESNIKNNEYHRTGSSLLSYLNAYYETSSIRTDKVDGGIGGFAGKLKDSGEGISFNSCNIATDVYAPLGINVGGIIGYLPNDPLLTKLPTITKSGSVNVVGKIFVGGYIGKTAGFGSETKSFFGNDGVVDKISSINVQQYYVRDENNNITDKTGVMAGNCVGGIIGYVAGHAYNIHLTSNDMSGSKSLIKVFNSNGNSIDSTYVGTLIGRLDGTMSNCSIASELCDAIPTDESSLYYKYSYDGDIQGIIQTPKMYNYGGLVGLVNTSGNVEIYGKHYYAFTVDILQSTNFGTDGTVYSYDYDEDASTLTAIAHYVNNGKINISVSGLTALYDGVDTSDNHNPTNQYASGWAKEYTLFRTFAYKKDQADASTGDHVQTIYSANYIMAVVATMGEYNIDNGSSTTSLQLSQEIVYTIYQPSNQSARMYTKYGIATQDSDFDPAYTSVESAGLGGGNHFYEFNYQLSLEGAEWVIYKNDTNKKFFDIHKQEPLNNKYGDVTQISGRNAFVKHLEDPTELGLTDQYKWDEKKGQFVIRETWDEDLSIICANLQYSFGYSYYVVDNYLGEGSTYFIFDVVFGDSSSLAMHCKEGDFEALLDNQSGINIPAIQVSGEEEFSASGSIFDVRGTASGVFATGIKDSQFGWKIGGIIVAAIIAIVAIILSNGLLAPILKGLATAVGAVKGAVSSFIAALVAKWGTSVAYFTISALCAIAAGSLGNIVFSAINNGTVAVEQQFSMIIDKEMGYLTQSYSHSISWNDGQMQFTSDAYRPSLVTVKLNGKNGSITTIASKPSEWTNYRWFLYENTLKGNTSPQLMFYYYSISTARSAPANINSQATVSIADLPSDSDLYMILNAMNVESVTIPRFQIIEDELYSYSASEVTGKILAPNYVYEKQRATNGTISENDLISDSGYAYLRLVGNETIVVPETETNWMINEYNQARIIKRSFESKITSGLNNKYPVDLSKLKWIVDMSSPTANADAQKEIFGDLYKGVTFTKTSEPPIDGTYYVQIDQDYYVYDTNGSVRLYVIPYVDNSGSGNGLTATQVGVSGDYQYVHLGTEDVSTGFYSEEFEYALYYPNDSDSFIKAKVSNISNNGMAYKLTEIGAGVTEAETDQLLKMVELTMYSFNPGANSNTVSGFFGNAEKKTLLDIRDNWDTYKTYSFSNQYYSPVSDLYDVQNGILYQKETCISYMTEFGKSADGTPTEQQYLYIPQYGSIENEIGFNDKFIYNSNGKKLYTRFNYGSDFLSTEVSYITGYDENGNPITDKQSIGNILMPKDDGVSTPCVFAESCRVSFNGYTTIAPNLNNLG